jgi:IclR family transcriptional regulator, KDG regulon repressor
MPQNYRVPMVEKAFRILECLEEGDGGLSLAEVTARAGVIKTSSFRILYTLARMGYVQKDEEAGKYTLTLQTANLGRKVFKDIGLARVARPHMTDLRDRFQETVNLAVLRDGEFLYIDILESAHSFRMVAEIGARAPLHASAVGKSIAAFLPEVDVQQLLAGRTLERLTPNTITNRSRLGNELAQVRKQGYSLDREEAEIGASCIAAPILNAQRQPVGAISVSGPTPRMRGKQAEIIRRLKQAAVAIAGDVS